MAAAMVAGYVRRFGQQPDRSTAELLLALLFIENDRGRAVIEHNWGNLSVTAGPDVDYWRPPWFDLADVEARPDSDPRKKRYLDLHQRMLNGKAPSAFRAFPDDDSGIAAWLGVVKPSMYDAAASGDPKRFAAAYWSSGYCPDPECKNSAPSFARLQKEIQSAGYFSALEPTKKKMGCRVEQSARHLARPEERAGLWFWAWGQLLRRRMQSRALDVSTAQQPGEAR